MKKTKTAWLFFALQLVFMLAVPCVIIWLQYGGAELGQKYKISLTAVLLLMFVFAVFKRVILSPWLKKIDGQIADIEIAQLNAITPATMRSHKKRYRRLAIIQLFFNMIVPVLVFALFMMTISVVQAGTIKLHGALVFCGISMAVGVLCRIGEIWALRCEHERQI